MRTAGKCRRQGAGRHDVLDIDRHVAAVEIVHPACAHVRRTDGQPRLARLTREKSTAPAASFREATSSSSRRCPRPARTCGPQNADGLGSKNPGMPLPSVFQYEASATAAARPPIGARIDLCAMRCQNSRSRGSRLSGVVAGDEAGVDGADRGADDPVRLDAGLVQRLVDTRLIGAERTAALKNEHDLLRVLVRQRPPAPRGPVSRISAAYPNRPPGSTARSSRLRQEGRCRDRRRRSLHRNTASAPICSVVTNWRVGWACSSTSRMTCSSVSPRALAVSGICFCTSGVST